MTTTLLPLGVPAASAYQFYAFPLAILASDDPANDWVMSNFIQTCYDETPHSPVPYCHFLYDYSDVPGLRSFRMNGDFIKSEFGEFPQFAARRIALGQYVYVVLDEFFVPGRNAYKTRRSAHDALIIGVDDSDGRFWIYGYTSRGILEVSSLHADELGAAFNSAIELGAGNRPIVLYERQERAYAFDPELIRRTLQEYLDGTDTSAHYRMTIEPWIRRYGIECYTPLVNSLEATSDTSTSFDLRHAQVLFERHEIMVSRVDRLAIIWSKERQLTHAQSLACELRDVSFAFRLAILRQRESQSKARLATSLRLLNRMEALDRQLTSALLEVF